MSARGALLRRLADGGPHEDAALAAAAGLDGAALAAELAALGAWGLEVEGAGATGHRLAAPLELIDRAALEAALGAEARRRVALLEVHEALDSTNARLLGLAPPAPGTARVVLAEFQHAGRGRRGRGWLQPYASGLCLSLDWQFAAQPGALGALSLASGVAALRALARAGVDRLALKWPNDVLRDGRKLGGILAELRLVPGGGAHVVIGIGVNVRLPPGARRAIEASGGLAPADLADVGPPSRTRLAAALVDELVGAVMAFAAHGFAPFAAEWNRADALRDRRVRVDAGSGGRDGIARGIAEDGALRVEIGGRIEELNAGEVSLRAVA
jgi:BirA family biotin operon repressor/biotin-[acetyl-CoA-carboxylase] ligase